MRSGRGECNRLIVMNSANVSSQYCRPTFSRDGIDKKTRNRIHVMLWAASKLCFFGFFRSEEITIPSDSSVDEDAHLSFKDVALDCVHRPHIIRVHPKPTSWYQHFHSKNWKQAVLSDGIASCIMVERGAGPGPFFHFQSGRNKR